MVPHGGSHFEDRKKNLTRGKAKEAWNHLKACVTSNEHETGPVKFGSTSDDKSEKTGKEISHGLQFNYSISVEQKIVEVVYNEINEEYVILDETGIVNLYKASTGEKLLSQKLEENLSRLVYMGSQMRYVGLVTHEPDLEDDPSSTLVLYSQNFEVLSRYHDSISVLDVIYNPFKRQLLTCGTSNMHGWYLHYEDKHLIPEVSATSDDIVDVDLSMMALEHNAGYSQRLYVISRTNCYVFLAHSLEMKQRKRSLHVRDISSVTYFNPTKSLLTGSIDGSIKMWDENWCVKVVFVGHNDPVSALSVYPNGPYILSSSNDHTLRVWSLETSDESNILDVHTPIWTIVSKSGLDNVAAVHRDEVFVYIAEDLYSLCTSVGEPVRKIRRTNKHGDHRKLVCSCEDGTVRIVCPISGNVITTVLLGPGRRIKDAFCVSRLSLVFCLLDGNEMVKASISENPATVVDKWDLTNAFDDRKLSCFCLYEHIGAKEMLQNEDHTTQNNWRALARAAHTEELEIAIQSPRGVENPVLLVIGLNDGSIGLLDIDTGNLVYETAAHEMSNLTCLVANNEIDQLVSAGTDKVVKVWKVHPFAAIQPLIALFPFFFPGTPTHVACLRNKIFVAYQDSTLGVYASSIQTQQKTRYEHARDDDHTDKIIAVAANSKMKLFVSASEDETLRVWSDHSRLIRVLKMNAPIWSLEFASDSGDLVVGIGDHLYRVENLRYFSRSLMYRAMTIIPDDLKTEQPLSYDENKLQSLDMGDVKRLKAAHCSEMKFVQFEDKLPEKEESQLQAELKYEKSKYFELAKRDAELDLLRSGQFEKLRKSKRAYNERIKQLAFKKYISIFFQNVKVDLPKLEESFEKGSNLLDKSKLGAMIYKGNAKSKSDEEIPEGFFPSVQELSKKRISGLLPNSVALKLLYPDDVIEKHKEQFKPREFTAEELAEMEYYNKMRTKDIQAVEDANILEKALTGDVDLPPTPPAVKVETKSGLMNKLKEAARTPSPSPEPEKTEAELAAEERDARVKEIHDSVTNKESSEQAMIAQKKSKPVRKFVSRPKQKSPEPMTPPKRFTKVEDVFDNNERHKTPAAALSEPDTPKPPTPLPEYITKNRGQDWYDNFFPNLNERTFPKPWYPRNFAQMVLRYIKICELPFKAPMVEYLKDLHLEWDLRDMRDNIIDGVMFVLRKSDAPTSETIYGRAFFHACMQLFVALQKHSFEIVAQTMSLYLEKDSSLKRVAVDSLKKFGVIDPKRSFYKEMDGWEVPPENDPNFRKDLFERSSTWLQEWIQKLTDQVEYVIDELRCGSMTMSGPYAKKFLKQTKITTADLTEPTRAVIAVLERFPGDSLDQVTPVEAINYYCECQILEFLNPQDQARHELMDMANRRTVLVLPKVPVEKSLVRVGELHTSKCRKKRVAGHYQLAKPHKGDVLTGFTTHINLPMKKVYMNPFGDEIDELMQQLEEQQPLLLMLKSNQKYFVPENSVPPPL